MIIAGIDEAGRGPCFGPMVISIASIEKKNEIKLKEIGVKDSKDLTAKQREEMFDQLKEVTKSKTKVLSAVEINDLMTHENLNEIEAITIANLINEFSEKIDELFIDSPDVTKGKFEGRIRQYLNKEKQGIKIVAENKADSKYLITGAASIIAKVTRDNEIKELAKKYGDFGSGYPSDPYTKRYLAEYVEKNKKLPPFSRIFWSTCTKALEKLEENKESSQSKLF